MSLGYIGDSLPSEWSKPLLIELVTPKQWKTIPTKKLIDEGYVVYGANGKIGFYDSYTHPNPTVMITCRGATCGNLHISEPFSYINGNAMALDHHPTNLVGLKFLYYALAARGLEDTISGSAQPQITGKGLSGVRVPLPPIAEQKVIADKLDTLLAQVENTKARLERIPQILKRFRQSIIAAATNGDLGGFGVDSWESVKLVDVVKEKPRNGKSPKGVDQETVFKNLTLSATTSGKFKENCFKYVELDIDHSSYLWVMNGDILIQRANTLEYVGVSALYEGPDRRYVYPDLMMKCTPNERVLGKFLHLSLLSEKSRKYFRDNATGTAGNMPKINQKTVSDLNISLPSIQEQIEIVRRAEQLFSYADTIEKQANNALARVEHLTQSILAKAFRGELTQQWRVENPDLISGDNSAQALLERIQAERAAAKPAKRTRKKKAGA
ncbi:restriction endonuclease subunit S [Microbulbifer elongatus]|uniref:restriction endonuclease subunit S n=1 Tax=Microbulbifer elongatus TaxID=86173 RepID=UPI001CFD2EF5|nr:restriction endonuclease subunit S [Microbulbifer elongatus]